MKKHNIEQRTSEWHQLRKGKITGTVLKSIMGTPKARQEAIYETIAQRLTVGVEEEYENAMERGNRLEDDAVATFELETGKTVERTGFCEDDTNPMIANSPDGLIGENEAVEIKCMGGKNHVKMWLTNEIPDEYQWQVVQYFVVNEKLEKLYFVGYNPDIPVHPLHIIEVNREEIGLKIENAKKSQEAFILEVESILSTIIKL
jgi:putative phage-type endonuclease